jgi:hypothetical protein
MNKKVKNQNVKLPEIKDKYQRANVSKIKYIAWEIFFLFF